MNKKHRPFLCDYKCQSDKCNSDQKRNKNKCQLSIEIQEKVVYAKKIRFETLVHEVVKLTDIYIILLMI